jgi:hypothetical protein
VSTNFYSVSASGTLRGFGDTALPATGVVFGVNAGDSSNASVATKLSWFGRIPMNRWYYGLNGLPATFDTNKQGGAPEKRVQVSFKWNPAEVAAGTGTPASTPTSPRPPRTGEGWSRSGTSRTRSCSTAPVHHRPVQGRHHPVVEPAAGARHHRPVEDRPELHRALSAGGHRLVRHLDDDPRPAAPGRPVDVGRLRQPVRRPGVRLPVPAGPRGAGPDVPANSNYGWWPNVGHHRVQHPAPQLRPRRGRSARSGSQDFVDYCLAAPTPPKHRSCCGRGSACSSTSSSRRADEEQVARRHRQSI